MYRATCVTICYLFSTLIIMASGVPVFSLEGRELPDVHDNKMKVQLAVEGLKSPISMAFFGPDDILPREK
jgi:hypothetical protein